MRLEEANLWNSLNRIEKLNCIAPLPYHDFIGQIRKAELILTDSGGVQEEAFQMGKPCVVLRTETEHKHALDSNLFHLCPLATAPEDILPLIKQLRSTGTDHPKNDIAFGQASKNAALAIEKFMHQTVRQR
jgi:UDP-N-acetylglucosamine 2-epimerase